MMEMRQQIVLGQGGVAGPLITWQEIRNSGAKFLEALQEKNIDEFIKNPEDATEEEKQAQAQPQPNPEAEAAQMEAQMKGQEMQMKGQAEQGKQQIEAAKLQQAEQHFAAEMELKWAEANAQWGIDREKLGLEGQKVAQDGELRGAEFGLKRDEQDGGEVGKNIQELAVTKQMAEGASEALTQWAELAQGLVARVEDMEARQNAPKAVQVVRDKAGRVQGAKVTQAGVTTDVTLN